MATKRLLFLLGGSEGGITDLVAEEFVSAAGGPKATIAVLLISLDDLPRYLTGYHPLWDARGVESTVLIAPGDSGRLDLTHVEAQLQAATGLFIGGGPTPAYHALYAEEPCRSLIRARYEAGLPVAGLSAGAMICPQTCLLRPTPKDPHRPFEIAQGLGLVRDLVVEVHFPLSREGLAGSALLKGMMRTRTAQGLGLASTGCAVLEDGRLVRVLGEGVFRVQMTAFDPCLYEVERIAPG